MKFDLGYGNSVCVRQAFLDTYRGDMIVFTNQGLMQFDYPKHEGDPELIALTRTVIKRQTGIEKKHVFITNGATGAVTIALRAYQQRGYEYCHTRNAPWYMNYPPMIKASGLMHVDEDHHKLKNESVILLDIPSNPLGMTRPMDGQMTHTVVLDGVYWSKIYMSGYFVPVPAHDVLAGSYSKLLGLNGIRVGWLATDDDLLAERIKELITGEYCGLSVASTEIVKRILFDFDWYHFEVTAKMALDYNREEWSKVEKFFGDKPVVHDGMFYYGPIDAKCRDLLEKSGINWMQGSRLGTDDNFGRFNLGQDIDLVRKAVKTMLRNDRLK